MTDWVTYGNNNARTGESTDTTLSASNVSSLHLAWAHQTFDFNVQTQPVVATNVPNVSYDGQTHTIVYVGAGSGKVYAFDAFSGQQLWKQSLSAGTYDCTPDGGTKGPFGVQGTFAIDRANGVVYVPDGVHHIHALDLASGADKWSVDAVESGSDDGSDSDLHEFVHTGLTLVNGQLYGGTSSTCDITPWRGRVFQIDVGSHTLARTYYPVSYAAPSGQLYSGGGVWGWGGVSSDGSSLYAGTGNADNAPQTSPFVSAPTESAGLAERVLRLSTTLGYQDDNFPNLTSNPDADDLDLSGTPMLFQPSGCPPLLALQGKQGFLLIYNRSSLSSGPIQTFQFSYSSDVSHYIGVPAYSAKTGLLYAAIATGIGSYGPGMAILRPQAGCSWFSVVAQPSFGPDSFSYGLADPRGTVTIANGVAFMGTPNGTLWARDATTGDSLWDSNNTDGHNTYGQQWGANGGTGDQIRYGPVVTGGWVYVVATDSGSIYALKVNGAATSSSLRQSLATSATSTRAIYPLPAAQVRYRPPQRRRNPFGKTPTH
jgi:outer membrane protein assembly factor BamB